MKYARAHLAVLAVFAAPTVSPSQPPSQPQTLQPLVDMRLRSEHVHQQDMAADAEAITLRARLGFETKSVRRTSLLAEAELIAPLATRYDSTVNGKTQFPVVADPETYEINRVQLVNTGIPRTRITLGRQRITQDDQRFVGNAGWRQNEQTFDALRVITEPLRDLTIDLTYSNQVNRPGGKDAAGGRYHVKTWLANVSRPLSIGRISLYAYVLDLEEAPRDSTTTFGVRVAGARKWRSVEGTYAASCARQRDHASNPLELRASICSVEAVAKYRTVGLGAGRETLTGDGTKGFATPLATLHAYQGWADKFVTTPVDGIVDRYATVGFAKSRAGRRPRWSATAVYHDFDAEQTAADLGSEIDFLVRAEWQRVHAALKLANYEAATFATDTRKVWAEIEYRW